MSGIAIIRSLSVLAALSIVWLGVPHPWVSAAESPLVSVSTYMNVGSGGNPTYVNNVPTGGSFVARVNVSQVSNFKAYQIQLNYNPSIIQVIGLESGIGGVTSGLIGSTVVPVDNWVFYPGGVAGAVRAVGLIPSGQATGSGYLAEIHFIVVGTSGQSSSITPTDVPSGPRPFLNGIFDTSTNRITTATPWSGTSVQTFPALQITGSSLASGEVGVAYSQTLAATGGTGPYTWSVQSGTLPTSLSLDGPTGTITGTPTVSGDFSVNVTVTDAFSPPNTTSKTLALHVFAPVSITTTSLPDGTQGAVYSTSMAAAGGKSPYSWSAAGLPAGLSVSTNGTLTGTPTVSGDFSVNVTVTDTFNPPGAASKTLVLHVFTPVSITTASLSDGSQGAAYLTGVAAAGGKSPYSWNATGLPAGLSVSTNGTIAGTPTVSGDFSVNFTVTDAFSPPNTANRTLAIHVFAPVSITTTLLPDGSQGSVYSVGIAAAGGKGPYFWSASGLPSGLTISTAGVISGTPAVAGDFSVNVTLTDSYSTPGSVNQTFSLHIFNAIQITTTALAEVLQNKPYSQTLSASGGNAVYTWSATGLPSGVTISAAGVISGTPTVWGDFIVNVTLTDSLSGTNSVVKPLTLKVYMPYDANGNGVVDMGDVVKVERIILILDVTTPAADANADGKVDASDIVKIERVILGIDQ